MIFTTIKHKILKIAVLSCCILNIGCNNDIIPSDPTGIKGELVLKLKAGDVKTEIITRSTLDFDINSFKINLSENDGTPLFVNKLYGELNETDCTLPAESGYQITAESCSQDESVTQNGGYGYPRFVGEATFNITPRQETHVNIKCTMVNAGLQISFDQTFLDKFPTHAITTQDTRALVFNKNNADKIGYYEVNANKSLKLRLTGSAGGWEDRLDTIKEIILEKGKIKRLLITYTDNSTRVICI
jgi:hypothetical protein